MYADPITLTLAIAVANARADGDADAGPDRQPHPRPKLDPWAHSQPVTVAGAIRFMPDRERALGSVHHDRGCCLQPDGRLSGYL
jgi:hypothetical protein